MIFFYERRKNYYRNIGRPLERFVTPMYIAAGYVAVILKKPAKASILKSRFMRNQGRYEQVFSERVPIEVWPRLASLLKMAELQMLSSRRNQGERSLKTWRGLIALLYAAKVCGRVDFSTSEFCRFVDINNTDSTVMNDCFSFVDRFRHQSARQELSAKFCTDVCQEFARLNSLTGIECLRDDYRSWDDWKNYRSDPPLPEEFLAQVDSLLPAQPWPRGIHIEVAEKLEVKRNKIQRAINQLIESGRRVKQIDGVLYPSNSAEYGSRSS